jgi:hypothetical protein
MSRREGRVAYAVPKLVAATFSFSMALKTDSLGMAKVTNDRSN